MTAETSTSSPAIETERPLGRIPRFLVPRIMRLIQNPDLDYLGLSDFLLKAIQNEIAKAEDKAWRAVGG